MAPFNIITPRRQSDSFRGLTALTVATLIGLATTVRAAQVQVSQTYFIPIPEDYAYFAMKSIVGLPDTNTIYSAEGIVASDTNTIIVYDEWEDGYETDIATPQQSTTQIWGDNNSSNGIPPGFATDIVKAGSLINLTNEIFVPRDVSQIKYDGRDRFASTKPLVTTRAQYALNPGQMLAGAVPAPDTTQYGTSFECPVGTNTPSAEMFSYAAVSVIASENPTLVSFDADADGTNELEVWLEKGETYLVTNVMAGARITSTRQIQAHMQTGDIGSTYEMRWYMMFPEHQWSDSYFYPEGSRTNSGGGTNVVDIFLRNPGGTNLTIYYQTANGTGSFPVAANSTVTNRMPFDSGIKYYTTNGLPFIALSTSDSAAGTAGNGQNFEWGCSLVPADSLSTMIVCPWGKGSGDLTQNGNPVWITPVSNTLLYVDYDGDPGTGANTDPSGHKYDLATNVLAYHQYLFFDTLNGDNDQSGLRAYSLSNAFICAAWGEDPFNSIQSNPYLDMGSEILPFPQVTLIKRHEIITDVNTNGYLDAGDSIEYTLTLQNVGWVLAQNIHVSDILPVSTTYTTNSTYTNGVLTADNVGTNTAYPLDQGGLTWGSLVVGETGTVSYTVQVNDPFPANQYTVVNGVELTATLGNQDVQDPETVVKPGLKITKTSSTTNIVYPGSNITYTITVQNTGTVNHGNVRIQDVLPTGMTYVANSTVITTNGNRNNIIYSDNFDAISYGNNNGPSNWTGNWIEIDNVGAGPTNGHVSVSNTLNAYTLSMHGRPTNGAYRLANVIGYSNVVLTYSWRRVSLDAGENGNVSVSSNGGLTWTSIAIHDGNSGTDGSLSSTNIDITTYKSTNTAIRFAISTNSSVNEGMDWDDIQLSYTNYGPVSTTNGSNSVLITGFTLRTNESITITMQATASDPSVYTNMTNTANVVSRDSPDPQYAYVTNYGPRADVAVAKSFSTNSPNTNDLISFTVVVTNNGPNNAGEVVVDDLTPTGLNYVSFGVSRGSYATNTGVWTIGTLTNGNGGTLTVTARVAVATGGMTITNTASKTNQNCIDPISTNNSTTATITVRSADLGLTKVVDNPAPRTNQLVTFTIVLTNNGLDAASNVSVTDAVPSGLTHVSNTVSQGSYNFTSGVWTVGSLGVNTSVTMTLTLRVNVGTQNTSITNFARIRGSDQADTNSVNNTAYDEVAVEGLDIYIRKTVNDSGPETNGTVVYTIIASNQGPAACSTTNSSAVTTTVYDTFGAISYGNQDGSANWSANWVEINDAGGGPTNGRIAVSNDLNTYVLAERGQMTNAAYRIANLGGYTNAVLSYSFARRGGLDAGEYGDVSASSNGGVTWTVIARHQGDSTTDGAMTSTNINIASYISTNTAIKFSITTNTVVTEGMNWDDIQIAYVKTQVTTNPGLRVTDIVPSGLTYTTSAVSQGFYVPGSNTWTVGGVVSGAFATLTITARVDLTSGGLTITNTASVLDLAQSDYEATNDAASSVLTVRSADLLVLKTADKPYSETNGTIVYTVVVTNLGFSGATNVSLNDSIPSGVTHVTNTLSQGSYSPTSGIWTVGTLTSNGAATMTITVTVGTNAFGRAITNFAAIRGSSTYDPVATNNSNNVAFVIADIRLTNKKTSSANGGPVSVGDTITYTVVVTNLGNITHTGLLITDAVPTGASWVSSTVTAPVNYTNSVLDTFFDISYSNNYGNTNWTLVWDEAGSDDNSPSAGDVLITIQNLRMDSPTNQLRRQMNLLGYTNGSLSLLYRREGLSATGDYVVVQVSSNGYGGTWSNLGIIAGPADEAFFTATNFNITPYLSTNTSIRFLTSPGLGSGENIYLDTVEMDFVGRHIRTLSGYDPPTPVHDSVLATGEVLTLTYQVIVTNVTGMTNGIVNTAGVFSVEHPVITNSVTTDTVAKADLAVTKTASTMYPNTNDFVYFTITITNSGPQTATGIEMLELWPSTNDLTYISAGTSQGSYNSSSNLWTVGSIASGSTATLTITSRVPVNATNRVFSNNVSITRLNQWDTNTLNNTNGLYISTLVVLSRFDAFNKNGHVLLEWETASEIGTAGFYLYRISNDGHEERITPDFLPVELGTSQGATYTFRYDDGLLGETASYVLEELEIDGTHRRYGPFTPTPVTIPDDSTDRPVYTVTPRISDGAMARFAQREVEQLSALSKKSQQPRRFSGGGSLSPIKLAVRESGVYFVDAASVASLLSVSTSAISSHITSGLVSLACMNTPIPLDLEPDGSGFYFYGRGTNSQFTYDNVYWLSWTSGVAMATANAGNPGLGGASVSRTSIHMESDAAGAPGVVTNASDDYWFWTFALGGNPSFDREFTFTLDDLAQDSSSITLSASMHGATTTGVTNEHGAVYSLNAQPVGSNTWTGVTWADSSYSAPVSLLATGVNTVRVSALLGPGAGFSVIYINSFDVDYPHVHNGGAGFLTLNSGNSTALAATNFPNSGIRLYQINSPEAPVKLTNSTVTAGVTGYDVGFQSVTGTVYEMCVTGDAMSVLSMTVETNSSLASPSNSASYVIIARRDMMAAAAQMVAHRQAQGLTAMAVALDDVYDEFNGGVADPAAIQNFLRYASANWTEPPRYVVLAGEGTYDYRNITGYGDCVVPGVFINTANGLFGSDMWFVDFDSNSVPDMAIGRLPIITTTELTNVISRISDYEESTDAAWQSKVMVVADNPDTGGEFASSAEAVAALSPTDFEIKRTYLADLSTAAARGQLLTNINNGALFFTYFGHGGIDRMASEGLLLSSDATGLVNGSARPIILSMSCAIGQFLVPGYDCLAEALMTAQQGGAAAVWAPSGLSMNSSAQQLATSVIHSVFTDGDTVLGDALVDGVTANVANGGDEPLGRLYNLLGDPATHFAGVTGTGLGQPRNLAISPDSLDFGVVTLGNTTDLTYTVQNVGTGTLSGVATTVDPYNIVSGSNYSLTSGQSQDVTIRFTPTSSGLTTNAVRFTGSGVSNRLVTGFAVSNMASGYLQFTTNGTSVSENAGTVTVTVIRAGGSSGIVTGYYATADGTAMDGTDYTITQGTLIWQDADTAPQVISVPVLDDPAYQGDRVFTLDLTGTTLGSPTHSTITIANDDPLPTFDVAGVSLAEGNSDSRDYTFAITLSAPSILDSTVDFATSNGTALAGSDYVATTGSVTIAAGQTATSITVQVLGDNDDEGDPETFFVNLATPVNATIGVGSGEGDIENDDAPPPVLYVTPASLGFETPVFGNPANQTLTVSNTSVGTLSYAITPDAFWLSLDNNNGTLASGQTTTHVAHVSVRGLAARTYSGHLTLLASTNSPQVIPVSLAVDAVSPPSRIIAWGKNGNGQTNVPSDLTNAIAVVGGTAHSLAVRSTGRVVAWGKNDNGQTNVPKDLVDAVSVAAGWNHSLALRSNGRVVAWGKNGDGQTKVPTNLSNVISMAAGENHSLALRSNGTVVAWGKNNYGQTNVPPTLSNVLAIAAGRNHSLALSIDGHVTAWGRNDAAQTRVPSNLTNAVAIDGGSQFSMALRADGTLAVWGNNDYGQTNIPPSLTNVVAIAAGVDHWLALTADGRLIAKGNNSNGQTNPPSGVSNVWLIASGEKHSFALVSSDNGRSGVIGKMASPSAQVQWLASHGWNNDFESVLSQDQDKDGMTTLQEYVADVDPNDAHSIFQIVAASNGPNVSIIYLLSSTGRVYSLEVLTNGLTGTWLQVPSQQAIPGNGGMLMLSNTPAPSAPRYYRVRVVVP